MHNNDLDLQRLISCSDLLLHQQHFSTHGDWSKPAVELECCSWRGLGVGTDNQNAVKWNYQYMLVSTNSVGEDTQILLGVFQ